MSEFDIKTILSNKSFQCFKCKATIEINQPAYNIINVCPNCFTVHSKNNFEKYVKIKNNWINKKTILPLNTTGKIDKLDIKIIGIAFKTDQTEKWIEYQLLDQFNENHILTEWKGHFHYLKQADKSNIEISTLISSYKDNRTSLEFQNKSFKRISKYTTSTLSLIGEFPYDVINISHIKCRDFVSPPELISIEVDEKETIAYIGRYVPIKEIRSIFKNNTIENPDNYFIGMAQPFAKGLNTKIINRFAMYFLMLFTVFHIVFSFSDAENYLIVSDTEILQNNQTSVSKSFILPEQSRSYYLSFTATSGINNQWIEDQITLVNEKTGEEREFSIGIEYYSGVDGGYSWSEGSNESEIGISDVQPGKYHIKEKLITSSPSEHLNVLLTGIISTPSDWNFGVLLLIILIAIFILNILKNNFDSKRMA